MPDQDAVADQPKAFGIKETKEALVFLTMLANYAVNWKGFNPATILAGVTSLTMPAVAALNNISAVPDELGDLTDSEIAELEDAVRKALDLPAEATKEIVGQAVETVLQVIRLGLLIKGATSPKQFTE